MTSFKSVDLLAVIIEPLMSRMVYGTGSNGGLALFDLFCLTRALSPMFFFIIIYLSRGIQFSRASLNGALTKHKNKDIETLKLDNQIS